MIEEKYTDLITAYLNGSLTSDQHQTLNALIEEGEIDVIDLKEMEQIYREIGTHSIPEPTDSLRDRFYTMLESEKSSHDISFLGYFERFKKFLARKITDPRLGYAIVIFLLGLLAGDLLTPLNNSDQKIERLSGEIHQMREIMAITLLDNSSPTERLKAVNISTEIENADSRVIDALIRTLNKDPNVNVRLATIEALLKHAQRPNVRKALVNAITNQASPIVQVALADAMLAIQETQAIEKFEKILNEDELDRNVRNKIENTLAALKK